MAILIETIASNDSSIVIPLIPSNQTAQKIRHAEAPDRGVGAAAKLEHAEANDREAPDAGDAREDYMVSWSEEAS